jgi:ribonuclease HI
VAKLLYLAKRGRPDLMLAVAFLATRVTCATNEDFNKLSKLIKYMEATKERVLFIGANDHSILYCYVDASFGVHKDTKSHTGIFMSLGYGPVYTQSKKQSIIARSSFEAEIIAVSDALSIALWHNQVLISLGESSKIVLLQDNQGVVDVLRSGIINGTHSKHIAVRFNWLLELISSVNIKVKWIPTENMIADTFTKPLGGVTFEKFLVFVLGKKECDTEER